MIIFRSTIEGKFEVEERDPTAEEMENNLREAQKELRQKLHKKGFLYYGEAYEILYQYFYGPLGYSFDDIQYTIDWYGYTLDTEIDPSFKSDDFIALLLYGRTL